MGPQIQWPQRYMTGDKVGCVHLAPNEWMLREHARHDGFPADPVSEVTARVDPSPPKA